MKTIMNISKGLSLKVLSVASSFLGVLALGACSDSIDDSNMFTSTEPTMTQFLESDTSYTSFVAILRQVKLSNKTNASSLASVLGARGNYTCFAPDNQAVQHYLDSVMNGATYDVTSLPDSVAQMIAKSSIIDCGTDDAYTTANFPVSGAFTYANMNGRLLTVVLDSVSGSYIINTRSLVTVKDIEVSNGEIHKVNAVISPSNSLISSIIENTPNMRIMGRLIAETGWADSLSVYRDLDYEDTEWDDVQTSRAFSGVTSSIPTSRVLGFTAFVETDDVLAEKWAIPAPVVSGDSITNWDDIMSALETKAASYYTGTSSDLTSTDNAINQFVSYHFIKGSIAYNKLVRHYNEYQYKYGSDKKNPQTSTLTVDVWNYFETMGSPRRLLKITQVAEIDDHPIYLNRKSTYNDDFDGNYRVESQGVVSGTLVNAENTYSGGTYENNALNGFIYPINDVLVYSDEVQNTVLNERIRFSITSIFPELYSNNLRGTGHYQLPLAYLDNLISSTNEENYYLCNDVVSYSDWRDMEGDEFIFSGNYDFTIKLPPVPFADTYELRMGLSNNSLRGMAQIYFGSDPDRLTPLGLPVDMRQSGTVFGWSADVDDISTNLEVDKAMRNQGYMKAPKYYMKNDGEGSTSLRTYSDVFRRIITQAYMTPGQTYYLRFKSALSNSSAQFFVNYFELVPRAVYASEDGEDIW